MNDLLIEVKENVANVRINRPHVMNALTVQTKKELTAFFEESNQRDDYRVIILSGVGDKAFCAGTDLNDMKNFDSFACETMLKIEHRMYDSIRHCNKIVIAAVNGIAMGGGCLLPLICDFSIVSDNVSLGFSEINNGLPASIDIAIIWRFAGLARAKQMVYLGESFTAKEAYDLGLINYVVPPASVLDKADELAKKILSKSATALRLQKELISKWVESDYQSAIDASYYACSLAFNTKEPYDAIDQFFKRKSLK